MGIPSVGRSLPHVPSGPWDEAYGEQNDSVAQARDDVLADRIYCFEIRKTGEELDDSGWPSATTDISEEESVDGEVENRGTVPSAVSAPSWAKLPAGDVAAASLGR